MPFFGLGRGGGPERGTSTLQFSELPLEEGAGDAIESLVGYESTTKTPTFYIESDLRKALEGRPQPEIEVVVNYVIDGIKAAREAAKTNPAS